MDFLSTQRHLPSLLKGQSFLSLVDKNQRPGQKPQDCILKISNLILSDLISIVYSKAELMDMSHLVSFFHILSVTLQKELKYQQTKTKRNQMPWRHHVCSEPDDHGSQLQTDVIPDRSPELRTHPEVDLV